MADYNSALFRAAIDELRPELAKRDHLRVAFMQIRDDETYFSTIAKDIYNIILDMIQPLRKSYMDMDHSAIIQSMQLFLDKYMCGGKYSKNSHKNNCRLDLEKLRRDFPSKFAPELDYYVISVKLINGCLDIYPWSTIGPISQTGIYLGQQFPKNSDLPVDTKIGSIYSRNHIYHIFEATPRCILPCGLIVFNIARPICMGTTNVFLLDPSTPEMKRSKPFKIAFISRYTCIDDNGNVDELSEYGDEILKFGPHGPEMMLFGVD